MVQYLPQDPVALEKINGFGPAKIKQFGSDFLKVITDYCKQHQLSSPQNSLPAKKPRGVKKDNTTKPGTKQETLRLFKEGKTIEEISTIRNLTNGTIETHLATFIKSGELLIETLLPAKKLDTILALLKEEAASLTIIKEKAGSDISFGEIRWVLAYKEYVAGQQTAI
jgi:ATP-dependent DNA helicase RecQ